MTNHAFELSPNSEWACKHCESGLEDHDSMITQEVMTKAEFERRYPLVSSYLRSSSPSLEAYFRQGLIYKTELHDFDCN
jgi:hypothetical protein